MVERDPGGLADDFLAAIVESSDDAIFGKDLDGTILSWNPAAERLYGYGAAEAVGRSVSMLLPADRPHELEEILARVRAGERVVHYETRRRRRDGSEVDVSVTVSPILDRDGRVVGASSIARDIGALHRAEEEYRHLFERHPSPMWIFDVETLRFLAVNDAAVAAYGWSREEFLAMTIADIRPEEDVEALRRDVEREGELRHDGRLAAPAQRRVGARGRGLLEPGGVRGSQRAPRARAGRHRAAPARAAARAGGEDRGGRRARRRGRPRLQQRPHGHPRLLGAAAEAAHRRGAAPRCRSDRRGGAARRRADAPAPRVQQAAGASPRAHGREHRRPPDARAARARHRRGRRDRARARGRAAADRRRPRPARAGHRQPRGQRARRDAGRRHVVALHRRGRARRGVRVRARRRRPGRVRLPAGDGLRHRHERRHEGARLRPVLHDEGDGNRARALERPRHRQAERRAHLALQRAGHRDDVQALLPGRRERRGAGARPAAPRSARRRAATRRSSSSRTRRRCASSSPRRCARTGTPCSRPAAAPRRSASPASVAARSTSCSPTSSCPAWTDASSRGGSPPSTRTSRSSSRPATRPARSQARATIESRAAYVQKPYDPAELAATVRSVLDDVRSAR